MADNPEVSQLIPINLATVCIESFLYGIFFVLYASSTYLLVRQGRAKAAAEHGSANSVYRAPMFIAAQIVFLTVTGHWVLTVYRLFQAFVNFRGGTAPLLYYANIALATEVAKSALLVATVLVSDAMIIYRLYIIWGYNKAIVVLPILTWFGLIAVGAGVCWRFSQYKIGDNVYDGPIGRWVTADCFFTLATNVYCTVCISYRVFRTRFRSRKHPSLASPNLLSALAILVESAALHTAWNALFLGAFQRASTLQFTAIDVWSPVAGTAFMLINLRVALGWAQRAHPTAASSFVAGTASTLARPLSDAGNTNMNWNWNSKRASYPYGAPAPVQPPPGAHSPRAYRSEWGQTRAPDSQRVSRGAGYGADPWQDQPWVVQAPHPYAAAAGNARAAVRVPLAVNVTRVVDRVDDRGSSLEEKSGWAAGEAV
ncbi:uncharacterized protein C8Q71DRAFT_876571 [Rhodofomes roseus]|uniref:Uncharacterized protein n=1 Tax=Rhodofomes roseus TaxID=34475 RepID=A0ABQ8KUT6_9APHY|nr:uncharacterized protein C8Q71DRAFT_876571 [Rhodofomes roseus]KAH9842576.1 hypothetical protein C8Q71DRAFT_876571 [Rhodofomes roseus]